MGCLRSGARIWRRVMLVILVAALLAPLGSNAQSNVAGSGKSSPVQAATSSGLKYIEVEGGVTPATAGSGIDEQLPLAGLGLVILAALGFTRWMRHGPIEELEERELNRKLTGRIYIENHSSR
jgi:hypothetical protein